MLTEGPCLAHNAEDNYNIVLTDASKTGLGLTLWQKQDDGNAKLIAYGSRNLNETEKVLHWRVRTTSGSLGIGEIRTLPQGRK